MIKMSDFNIAIEKNKTKWVNHRLWPEKANRIKAR